MKVFGIAHHSPDYLYVKLKKYMKTKSIKFVDSDYKFLNKPTCKYLIFLDPLYLRSNLELINSPAYNKTTGFVLSSPVKLSSYKGIHFMDFTEAPDIHLDAYLLGPLDFDMIKPAENLEVVYERERYTNLILDKVKSFRGILTKLMSFVYTLPNSTHQKPVKELACFWLASDESESDLIKRLDKLSISVPLDDKKKSKFLTVMFSEEALLYKSALTQLAHLSNLNAKEFLDGVAKYGVSAYEIRYIRAIVSKTKIT